MSPLKKIAVLITSLTSIAATEAGAGPIEISTVEFNTSDSAFLAGSDNQGWWSATKSNFDSNDNYTVGWNETEGVLRNFFTFDLSTLSGLVIAATLEVARFGYNSADDSEILSLFDVSTDAAILNRTIGTNASIFEDLGSGTRYGTYELARYGNSRDELLAFNLNLLALRDINLARGGYFSIGGALQSLSRTSGTEYVTTSSDGAAVQRLVLRTVQVPEPGTLALLGVGIFGIGLTGRRKV